jgi:tape measure domain-containing protein
MAAEKLEKIYELRSLGYEQLQGQLTAINTSFAAIRKEKEALNKLGKTQLFDPQELAAATAELQRLKVEEAGLRIEKQRLTNEMKAQSLVRAQARAQMQEEARAAKFAEGSYAALYNQYKQLYALVKSAPRGADINFGGQTLGFDAAISKLKELAAAEQDFRRQFQRDGLLVGEYTSGIVQAFKSMGLDDLIGGQITRANERLSQLNAQFDNLQKELRETGAAGKGALEALEKDLIDNRREAIQLQASVARLQADFRGTGDVGNQITTSIANGFKNAKEQVGALLLSYVGFQAAIGTAGRVFDTTVQLDSLDAALANVSKSTEELAINEQFLADITARLGLEYIQTGQAFKGFFAAYTAAGGSADEAREIYEAAAEAGAALKLSQEDINGVFLAFGQVASKGKVQAEELRGQIGERIPGAFSIAAKAIGVSQQELNKMLETGQVMSADFLPKFAAELRSTFGNGGKEVQGLQANVNRLKNDFSALIQNNQAALSSFFNALFGIARAFFTILNYLPQIVALLGLLAIGWAANNLQLVLLNAQLIAYNLLIVRNYIALGILSAATLLYNTALLVLNTGLRIAAAGARFFGVALATSTGPLGIILTLVGLVGGALLGLSRAFGATAGAIEGNTTRLRIMEDVTRRTAEATRETVGQVESLTAVAKDNNLSLEAREAALRDLIAISPEYLSGLTLENIATEEGTNILNNYISALRNKAALQATFAARDERLKKQTELELLQVNLERRISQQGAGNVELTDEEKEYLSTIRKQFNFTASVSDIFTGGSAAQEVVDAIKAQRAALTSELDQTDELIKQKYGNIGQSTTAGTAAVPAEVDLAKLKADIEAIDKQINSFRGSNADLQALIARRKQLQDQLDALLGNNRTPAARNRASSLTGAQKDDFKDIDAARDEAIAAARLRRGRDEIDEETYLAEILRINTEAIDKKLALIKGKNAEERKTISELRLEKIKLEQDTNDAVFALREKALVDQFNAEKRRIELTAAGVQNDPAASAEQQAAAKLQADQEILAAQVRFNTEMLALEDEFSQRSKQNAESRANEIIEQNNRIRRDEIELGQARLADIAAAGERERAQLGRDAAARRLAILEDTRLTQEERDQALAVLDGAERRTILSSELATLNIELEEKKRLFGIGAIAEIEYLKAQEAVNNKAAELQGQLVANSQKNLDQYSSDIGGFIRGLSGLIDQDLANLEIGASGISIGQVIADSFDIAKDAMNGYFDAQRDRIKADEQLALDRLQVETDQRKARAQTEAEAATIEKQAEAERERIRRESGEKLKKQKRQEVLINLATEISAIAVQAASNPANAVTFGTAGVVQFAILSALAGARAALQIGAINRAQFARGGMVPTESGGQISGPLHSGGGVPFNYEAEGGELAIVNRRTASSRRVVSVTGTPMQIASAINELGGGVRFQPGARIRRFEYGGLVGESLQAPTFVPAAFGSSATETDRLLNAISEQSAALMAVNGRIDRLQVVQTTSSVTDAQRKQVQQQQTGTL